MFQLHDKTRRWICLAAFFLLCVTPTLFTAAWCTLRHLPWAVQNEAESLSRQLGLEVRLAGLKNLRPGTVLYEGLELADPETGQSLFRCRLLEVSLRHIADGQGNSKPMLILQASQPEIETTGLRQLAGLLQRAMQGQTGTHAVDLRVTAGEMTLRAGRDSQTLTGVEGSLDNLIGGVQAAMSFRFPGTDATEPVKFRVVRTRQTAPPANGFELHTGSGEIPCELLAAGLPEFGGLGSGSRFRGYIWANQDSSVSSSGNWSGEATGQLLGVDLSRLVSDHFPHRLSGTAEVTIQAARFRSGRLEEARGTIVAGPGMIGRSLLESAVNHLGLFSSTDLGSLGDQTPYDRLALDIVLDGQGLRIEGRCPSTDRGVIMTDRRLCLLSEPMSQPQPVTALLQTLAPEGTMQVPATIQTDWLVSHLPMPQAAASSAREAALPSAHLRLRQE
jgi:hypothetical protein